MYSKITGFLESIRKDKEQNPKYKIFSKGLQRVSPYIRWHSMLLYKIKEIKNEIH